MTTKAKKKETTEVVKTAAPAMPAKTPVDMADWGGVKLTARDIVIPKILAMQGLSKLVTDGKAKFGEFRDSLNSNLVGSLEAPIEFVPFLMEKVWIVFEDKNPPGSPQPNFKFVKTEKIDASNENWPYEEVVNGVKIRRDRTMNFYVLLTKDLAEGNAIPHILSFRRTSARAGQKLATTMYMKNIAAGYTPASMVLELTGTRQQNDKGTFVVLDVKEKRATTQEELGQAKTWLRTVTSGSAKVDNSDLEAEAEQFSRQTTPAPESTDY